MRIYYDIKKEKFVESSKVDYKDVKRGVVIATNTEKEALQLINDVIDLNKKRK